MTFGIKSHYLIRPKPALNNLLTKYPKMEYLGRSAAWTFQEGSRSMETRESIIEKIKLVFAAHFRANLRRSVGDNYQSILDEIFPDTSITVQVFDKWWELEPLALVTAFGEVVGQLTTVDLQDLAKTGTPQTDEWIDWIVAEKTINSV